MIRFSSIFWFIAGALTLLLLAGSLASAQAPTQPRNESILSGFLACSGPKGEQQCPFRHHYLELAQGQTYALRLESTAINAGMLLEDEYGNLMGRDTDDFDTMPGCIVFRPAQTGTYRLVVTGKEPLNEGFYTVRMRELPTIFRVEDDLTPADALSANCHTRRYDVPMLAGRRYVIDLTSSDFAPYLKLQDMDGMIVAFQDESSPARGARIVFTPTRDATFRIVATTFEPFTLGTFALNVNRAD